MRLSPLPAALVAGALLTGIASCATTIDGSGTVASDVVAGGPSGTAGGSTPEPTTQSPGPTTDSPTPTTDPAVVKQRLLCVLERAAITSVNDQFNKSKNRDAQIRILRTGASTIKGHLTRSGLPAGDGVRKAGQGVLDQLNRLVSDATGGKSPSTTPYNAATTKFQTACNAVD